MLNDWIFSSSNDMFNYEIQESFYQDDLFSQGFNDLMSFNDIFTQDFFQNDNDLSLNNRNTTTNQTNESKNVQKVILDENDQSFKNNFYSIFTKKKRINKNHVKKIHNRILVPILGFQPMTRNEFRCIARYFRNYSYMKDKILNCLKQNKAKIQQMIQIASHK